MNAEHDTTSFFLTLVLIVSGLQKSLYPVILRKRRSLWANEIETNVSTMVGIEFTEILPTK